MKEVFAPYTTTQPINRLATNKGLRLSHSDYLLDPHPPTNTTKSSFATYNNTTSSSSSPASSVVDAEADRYHQPKLPIHSTHPSDRRSYPPHPQRSSSSSSSSSTAYTRAPTGAADPTSLQRQAVEEEEVKWSEMELKAINDDIGKVKVIIMTPLLRPLFRHLYVRLLMYGVYVTCT